MTDRGATTDVAAAGADGRFPLRLYLVLGSLIALAPLATDLYLPGLPDLAESLGASSAQAQLTISATIIGLALGQLVMGPISDRVGRRPPLLAGFAVFVAASVLCSFAPSIGVLLLLRFVQGFAGSAGTVIARACVRDMVEGAAAARVLSRLILVMGLAPVLGPVVGGQVLRVTDWRGLFLVLAGLAIVILIAAYLLLPETHPVHARLDGHPREQWHEVDRLLRDRAFLGYLGVGSFLGVILFSWISSSSFVLTEQYAITPQQYSAVFACTATAFVLGAQVNAWSVGRVGPRHALQRGLTIIAAASALLLLAILRDAPLPWVVAAAVVALGGYGGMAANSQSLAMTPHGHVAGTASALLGTSQFFAGALVPPIVSAVAPGVWGMPVTMLLAALGALAVLVLVVERGERA
jgi:MFS transporter, DHA1 family, multidrug resistance protein